ncbi:MAG: Fe2+-dependent dioxygenase [Rudaea sp.]|nr:Fe2+-dependent dioxygenase [Rudaea sp.]
MPGPRLAADPMQYEVFRILDHAGVDELVRDLASRQFIDGKATAGGGARDIKHNLQTSSDGAEAQSAEKKALAALTAHADFCAVAMPQRIAQPFFSRYEPGMYYGPHIDSSFMGGFNGVRTDLALTLFLSPPSSYDGGELVIHRQRGEEPIKLDAGEAIVYSAGTLHRVAPVTRGVRLAMVTWIQSAIGDADLRETLLDLGRIARQAEDENCSFALALNRSLHNLIRYATRR